MNTRKFSIANRERCEAPDGFRHPLEGRSLSDWFLAAIGEFGEAANVAKKLNRVRDGIPGNKLTPEHLHEKLAMELADAYIYLDLICQHQGIDIGEAVAKAFNDKSVEIGYKKVFTTDDSELLRAAMRAAELTPSAAEAEEIRRMVRRYLNPEFGPEHREFWS